ncbi:MAG: MupG family TIM beta-alpha barrel fold protein [Eubacteriales bacterium]|nr:MupG family TIM beta-alpha barrel fold protein [Eubacteriales bacterium]
MNQKRLLGMGAYLGMGEPLGKIASHLEEASKAGLNAVFTSLQLPESDSETVKKTIPQFAEIAHSYGLLIDADVSPKITEMLSIDKMDTSALRSFGLDIARLDYGYTTAETAAITNNTDGLMIEINASMPGDKLHKIFRDLENAGANKDNIRACHNYYPKAYTGLTCEQVKDSNTAIHEEGIRVAGFIPSLIHRRTACNDGLPTLERHRFMNVHSSTQEMLLLGFDDIFIGDDFAGVEEMKTLTLLGQQKTIELRIELVNESEEAKWLAEKEFHHFQTGLEHFIRFRERYPGPIQASTTQPRKCGDITIDNSGYGRYCGEVNIVRKDIPGNNRVNLIARVLEEDRSILELITGSQPVKLVL